MGRAAVVTHSNTQKLTLTQLQQGQETLLVLKNITQLRYLVLFVHKFAQCYGGGEKLNVHIANFLFSLCACVCRLNAVALFEGPAVCRRPLLLITFYVSL